MAPKSFLLSPELDGYLVAHQRPLDDIQSRLIAETEKLGGVSGMQISPGQGALMGLLTSLLGARHALEVGTFTGYSALCVARALPPDGTLLCCDVSEEWTAVGRRYWQEAAVADRIELVLGPATETLASRPEEPPWDLVFIDADKPSYPAYWELVVPRTRPGGAILVDNTLWSGHVADPANTDETTQGMRAFNDMVAADDRVESVVLPIADGLTLARRVPS
ncbi:MAG: O-methyltransferase [Acidimicrobiales bacterium]